MTASFKILALTGVCTVAATGYLLSPAHPDATVETEPAGPVAAAAVTPTVGHNSSVTADAHDMAKRRRAQLEWEQRRNQIGNLLETEVEATLSAADIHAASPRGYAELVRDCTEDLGSDAVGAMAVSVHEIGAPGVGTIYESVELIHENFDDPALLECITQSMYSLVGEAPPRPYERTFVTSFRLGGANTDDERLREATGYIFGAHMGEVRCCGQQAGDAAGAITYTISIADDGTVASPVPGPRGLPVTAVECLTTATKRWRYPADVAGKTFTYEVELPVPGQVPMSARPL